MRGIKKAFFSCLLIFSAATCWTANWFAYGGSFGTSAIVEGNKSTHKYTNNLHRVVLEFDATAELIIHPALHISIGSILLTDFNFKDGNHYNSLDYSFYTGLRIYPGLAGLRFGIDYNLGSRIDFIQVPTLREVRSTDWGNGFRILLEYDFRAGEEGFLPIVGGSWRHIPRGGSSDHIFSIYFKLLYR